MGYFVLLKKKNKNNTTNQQTLNFMPSSEMH